ncbi:RsmE family RNA methyltransferase [Pelagicoccus sp. SDUM812002]|uniref:RsmE family RNA methyltransferase n=1 Tax=Pelagicoccus sp. SDUM812002 TaxID=3041266 RepID=UPI00280DA9D7|nr:RsmE family RNA methyltransferase [Pelagicoccus sp. SDUM812002]MDQ8187266.1 RsmE family RNA methyltransferase [Pelagicoccus sp. SDUM812002]
MPDFRSYHERAPQSLGEQITLSPEESNHLVAANRARVGDPVSLFDGLGCECEARLVEANKRKAVVEVLGISEVPHPDHCIALAQALPKGKLIESIIRKASEIGAQQIFPIVSQRCEAKIDERKQDTKNAKWSAAALEGAKQSGNPHLVEVKAVSDLHSFLEQSQSFELKLVASLEPQALSLKQQLATYSSNHSGKRPSSAICLVGPEGDFTPEEYRAAADFGFLSTRLGPHVMRSETAAVHALSLLHYEITGI